MNITYPVYKPSITELESKYVNDCLASTWISSKGEYISKFESSIRSYIGIKHAITTFNGTVALHLALLACNIIEGDEVIIPDFTYIATANAVRYTGAEVIPVDVSRRTWNITLKHIIPYVTPRTKVIIVTDIYGTPPSDIDTIKKYCQENNIYLIDDSAESLGAEYKGRKSGALADISIFSFFGNKTITTGEGGMILTESDKFAESIRRLKNQGNSENIRYYHDILGYNYRMTNIQAAIGFAQMQRIDNILERKRNIYNQYKAMLHELVEFQYIPEHINSSYWMVSFLLKDKIERDSLSEELKLKGIETRPFFYPVHQMPFYQSRQNRTSILLSQTGINVPSYPDLSEQDVNYICKSIVEILERLRS